MGCFDSFIAPITCPNCGEYNAQAEIQSKAGACNLKQFVIGEDTLAGCFGIRTGMLQEVYYCPNKACDRMAWEQRPKVKVFIDNFVFVGVHVRKKHGEDDEVFDNPRGVLPSALSHPPTVAPAPEHTYTWNPGVYRHYRNKQLYLLLGNEQDRTHLAYMALYPNEDGQYLYRRTFADFFEVTEAKGAYGEPLRRFEPVSRKVWVAELTDPRYYNMVQAFLMIHGEAFE